MTVDYVTHGHHISITLFYYAAQSAANQYRENPDSMKRYFLTAILASAAFAPSVFAQGMALPPGIAAETKAVYNSVKTNLIAAANAMPESNYSFSPVPEEMNFGAWVAHVADAQTGICSTLNGQTRRGDAATKTSKADLVAALMASFDECDKAYNALTDANATELVAYGRGQNSRAGRLGYNSSHDQECYGSMAVYMRIKGIVPPSTAARTTGGRGGSGGGRGMAGPGR
jgi:hypothetical protein